MTNRAATVVTEIRMVRAVPTMRGQNRRTQKLIINYSVSILTSQWLNDVRVKFSVGICFGKTIVLLSGLSNVYNPEP